MRYSELVERTSDFNVDAYHGTTADFDAFDPSLTRDIGIHFGTPAQADRATRDWFGKPKDNSHIIPVKLRLRNPLRVRDMFDTMRTRYIARAKTFTLETKGFHPNQEERAAIYAAAKAADKARQKAGGDWGSLNKSKDAYQAAAEAAAKAFWQAIQASAERQGYDGFVYNNRVEGKGDSYVVFDPRNIRARHAAFDPAKADSDKLLDSVEPLQEAHDGDDYFELKDIANVKGANVHSPNSRETLSYMSPTDFLSMAEEGHDPESFRNVIALVKRGTKFNTTPKLFFAHDTKGLAIVVGHEGRHRARVLQALGVQQMPVVLVSVGGSQTKAIRWGTKTPDQIMPTKLRGQDNRTTIAMPQSVIFP